MPAVRYAGQEEPWIIPPTCLPIKSGVSRYALRFRVELGFKALKSLRWKGDKTRRTGPARVSRHWPALPVAAPLAPGCGARACPVLDTGVEDAQDRRIEPGNLGTPPRALSAQHHGSWQKPKRKVSVIRHGIG